MSEDDRQKWNQRYREQEGSREPSRFLQSLEARLPAQGRALDVAGGSGHDALWLARRGLDVTLVDISEVALARAEAAARKAGVGLRTQQVDLEAGTLPPGPFDVVLCLNFLLRPLFAALPERLSPGGLFIFAQPTLANLQRHRHPSARFLLEEGELPQLLQGLEAVSYSEGWTEEGTHEARLAAIRLAGGVTFP
ncbi:class I SAM-dependent methyltransferase [Stigmatella aurantiaca]|uniref:Methyltransferase type 11 n=1 Tax=Stigmatella aurantiaca (strain DW4/3-1) TaxID=378806 RepID=Q09B42_STIAD|nr:methyltransferase domain-containing protein [Stigmatella aurantiaca]ADO69202.1 Methyltransferase type 11 [Stigmatella aurantiaca DW4/3-1]EAU68959.1 tellurite resistance protein TehB [Stigmatella aurantiaca DW4/3-1]